MGSYRSIIPAVGISKSGDPLERLSDVVNFEAFRYRLEKAVKRSDGCKGGRPPYDLVLMFKILVLQALYTLSANSTIGHLEKPGRFDGSLIQWVLCFMGGRNGSSAWFFRP